MDPRRRDRIKTELKKAEEYLSGAEQMHKLCLYTPSVTLSYYSSYHAAIAAFLTVGLGNIQHDKFTGFMAAVRKFNVKLDPYLEKLHASREAWSFNVAADYAENESLLRLYQTRDFVLEVKDFLRRSVKI